jgi:hypothetical protein
MSRPTKEMLEKCFKRAMQDKSDYVGVAIKMPFSDGLELIINPRSNFRSKLEYYQQAYDDNLEHRNAEGIRIVGFSHGDFLQLARDLTPEYYIEE